MHGVEWLIEEIVREIGAYSKDGTGNSELAFSPRELVENCTHSNTSSGNHDKSTLPF